MVIPSPPSPAGSPDVTEDCCKGYGACCFRPSRGSEETQMLVMEDENDELDSSEASYKGDVGQLEPGRVVSVHGEVLSSCERFSVNLVCAKDKGEVDIALHINPRVSQRYVVRNSRLRGSWGSEETACPVPFPLERQRTFTIDIFVGDESFFIQINGKHFCQYGFRTAIHRICGVEVRGAGVTVREVRGGRAASYPAGGAPPPALEGHGGAPPAGGCAALPAGLARGQQLQVCARVRLLPHSFYLNLQSAVQLWPHPDIALHFNPRFMAARRHLIIMNSWQKGNWGDEERAETGLLAPGDRLELYISCEDEHYSVWLRDSLLAVFRFRLPPASVRAVLLCGDLTIASLRVRPTPPHHTVALCLDS